ncbi:MAG: hypothetical protein ACLFWD_09975, partial [Anaerolineales bacterium]
AVSCDLFPKAAIFTLSFGEPVPARQSMPGAEASKLSGPHRSHNSLFNLTGSNKSPSRLD